MNSLEKRIARLEGMANVKRQRLIYMDYTEDRQTAIDRYQRNTGQVLTDDDDVNVITWIDPHEVETEVPGAETTNRGEDR